jgi:hypothetical protein
MRELHVAAATTLPLVVGRGAGSGADPGCSVLYELSFSSPLPLDLFPFIGTSEKIPRVKSGCWKLLGKRRAA